MFLPRSSSLNTRHLTEPIPQGRSKKPTTVSPGSIGRKRSHADVDVSDEPKPDTEVIDEPSSQLLVELHDGKRSRISQGPRDGASDNVKTRSESSKSLKKSESPPRQRLRSIWSTRFLEGSMNDRPSNKPPSIYIGDEHLVEQYIADQESRDAMTKSDAGASCGAGIESNRPSSMYRFGKAIANAFNPSMVWQGIHEMWKEKSADGSNLEEPQLEDRRVKAEEAYAALKRIGYPGTQGASSLESTSVEQDKDTASQSRPDSGIDLDSYRSSKERKRDDSMLDNEEALGSTLSSIGNRGSIISGSEPNSRSSTRLNKPAFSTLRKVKSHFQLPSNKRNSAILAAMTPDETGDLNRDTEHSILKKQMSKKDLHKQQKLSKKVSDLESQLEKARRELHMSMDLTPPVPPIPSWPPTSKPRPFIPGALASLPSERLLSRYLGPHSTPLPDPSTAEIDKALGFPEEDMHLVGLENSHTPAPAPKTHQNDSSPAKKLSTGQKRKSGDAVARIYMPSADEEDVHSAEETNEKRDHSRSSKLQEDKQERNPASPKTRQKENISPEKPVDLAEEDRTVSSFLAEGHSAFNPAQVDQAKILAMRSNPNSSVPFGKLSDDIVNLRKEYPGITNDQMVKYISFILDGEKKHPSRKASMQFNSTKANTAIEPRQLPALGRPRSASPSKRFPKTGGSLSPPPSRDYSKKAETRLPNLGGVVGDEVVTVSPTKDKTVPPVPKLPKELEGQKAKVAGEVVQKEDFQWDDDVF